MPKRTTYNAEVDRKNLVQIRIVLSELPSYVTDFDNARSLSTSTRTRLAYAYDIRRFFQWWKNTDPALAETEMRRITLEDIAKVTARDLQDYMNYLESDRENPNARVSIARKLAAIGALFKHLYKNDDIPADPCAKVNRPKLPKNTIRTLDDTEAVRLLYAIKNGCPSFTPHQENYLAKTRRRDYAIALLFLSSGIRVSECVGLNLDDIDLEGRKMLIYRKGGKFQSLPLSVEVAEALQDYLTYREKITPADQSDAEALFLSMQEKRLTKASVEKIISKYAKAIGIKGAIGPHKLRATFATTLYQDTRDIYIVANALGHENVNTTAKHYANDNEDSLREVIDRMSERHRKQQDEDE